MVCYYPDAKEVYSTRNALFDETFFPMRMHDQCVFGCYDTTPRTRMIVDEYSSMEDAEQNHQELNYIPAARLLESVQLAERTDLEMPCTKVHK